jgi:hypothetical protein
MVRRNTNTNKSKANTQNANNLLDKQFDTKTQLSDMLEKTLSVISYSPEKQREQITSDLEQKYLNAQTNLQTAPIQLEETKKNYYVYKNGTAYYNDMLTKDLTSKADVISKEIASKFNEETENANTMNAYYNTDIINSQNTKELYDEFLKKNATLGLAIKNSHGDVLTNDRKTYYQTEAIDNVKLWYKFLFIAYYILVAAFVVSIILYPNNMSRVKQLFIVILLCLYPYIIDPIIRWIYSLYLSLHDNAPSNVYLSI